MDEASSLLQRKYDRTKNTLANPEPWERLARIKGAPFVAYREMLARAESGELLTGFPIEVLLKTTLNCNHSCPKCLHGMHIFPAGRTYNMSLETCRRVLDEGKAKGLQSVVFTGGEPTMNSEFTEFLAYAAQLGFPDVSLVTNGSFLTDEMIRCIIESGVTRINVSLDATTPETYDRTHGVDHFERCFQNTHRILELREELGSELPLLSVSFVLSQRSQHELDDFVAYWSERADGGVKIYPYKDIFSVVDDQFSDTYGAGRKQLEDLDEGELPDQVPENVPIMDGYRIQCTGPWYRCHVGINGEIQACTTQGFCDHPEMVLGNIHETSLEEVWKSPRWESLRDLTKRGAYGEHPVCKLCQASTRDHADHPSAEPDVAP